ncbi:MAG: hypothetical protein UX01_C0008G0025 [Candidatus Collierbacteria bacterium GW2011_GWB2_45_17]|uniref:Uncharacterized protein n=2 Tax=Candidatus Collieribacteriota TaxID=1752725 RepID=A0A0G1MYC2_9BACT|nr:MAG: hypothetical protein UW48_C0010G0011 [Microgenomates group bacterium GW2011_GWC1_44_23]KKT85777.1 MAG: hypothetical protein UW84_C0022G0009 [Candidatus Collierbacteria bacterium GW2011_GWA2_44_99]KKT94559.1 MAG: hypothetical protein UW96_C0019G0004 [Candidatus Collierbacteria bacterium GW2011_GWA1_45_15]KKT99657.1 MAG: hypothetical protein UX01_C0008G0025 [Candidatus Collierbacteria bacterium GW2011_GWB2_45_17]KKU07163.1 MAG: hypothetical protein UX11_C0019G0003 [Candidatus Collierbacte
MTAKGYTSVLFYLFLIALIVASLTPVFGLGEVTRTAALQISGLFVVFSIATGLSHKGERQVEISIMAAIALGALMLMSLIAPSIGVLFVNSQLGILISGAAAGLLGYVILSF